MPVAVLCYHDLAWPKERYSWLKIDVERFERHIILFKKIARFIRPDELMEPELLPKNRLHLLLTFDDGLVNNYKLGLPVLKRHDVPALFFLSTWHMESGEPFWFNRLVRGIHQANLQELDLRQLGLRQYSFNLSDDEKRWNGIQLLLEDVKKIDTKQDGEIINSILSVMGKGGDRFMKCHEDDRPLNRDEVLAMRDSGMCWFGSHSHHHILLPRLDDDLLMRELRQSRTILEDLLGVPVVHISYPNGDADERVREACRKAGFCFGYTVAPGKIGVAPDLFQIPRIMIGGFDNSWRLARAVLRSLL